MPPKSSAAADARTAFAFEKDEKVLCFHGAFLYEAKVLKLQQDDPKERKSPWKYFVHYKGWKNTWDDWVPEDRLRKFNDENKSLAADLLKDFRAEQRQERAAKETKKPAAAATTTTTATKRGRASGLANELASVRGSEDRSSAGVQAAPPRGVKRARDWETIEKEETFLTRPSIRIPIPDTLKGLLVDDWENVTKSMQLIPLPHPMPVSSLLAAYSAYETPRRRPGSADADILEEVIAGVREYFDKSLGRILLYRFERQQWLEASSKMAMDPDVAAKDEEMDEEDKALAGKTPNEVYGAEHLCRLFVSMPELIAQTNMDAQSVNRLREELVKMAAWLAKGAGEWFVKAYVDPGQEYIEKSKGTG